MKVTSNTDLTTGHYLIVNETNNVAFNGGLTKLDAGHNTIEVEISNNEIEANTTTNGANFYVNINGASSTIMSASEYFIGATGDSNSLVYNFNDDQISQGKHYNTISIDDNGNAVIRSQAGPYLRFNEATGDNNFRFRYYKSTGYTGQAPIQLYKLVTGSTPPAEYNIYRTITAQNPNDAGGWLGNWTNCTSVGDYNTNPTGYEVKALSGEEVTFTAGANNGYEILTDNISIKDANNNNVTVQLVSTNGSEKQFKFTMPTSDVTISAYFTFYRPTLRIAGRFNGRPNTTWITGDSGPAFTYTYKDENNTVVDRYTLDVYFSNPENLNFFWFRQDGNVLKAAGNSSEGDYGLVEGNLNITHSLGGERNFRIIPGLYTFTVNGDRTQLSITRITPTITFNPAAGTVEQGTHVSATSTLTSIINAIQAADPGEEGVDPGAQGTVSVQVSTDGAAFSNEVELNDLGDQTVYGKASIGSYVVPGNATATYNVVAPNTSNKFELVTDLSKDLVAGKKYLIVNENNSTAYTGNGDSATEIAIADHKTTIDPANVAVLTLGGETNAWTFYFTRNGSTYNVYHTSETSTGDNSLSASTSATASKFSISLNNNGVFDISADSKHLRANQARDFRFYNDNSIGVAIQLYKQTKVGDYHITYAEVTGGTASGVADADAGDEITVTVTANTGYASTGITVTPGTVEVTDNHNGTYTFTMPANDVTVTPIFAVGHAITYAQVTGGSVSGVTSAAQGARVEVTVTPDAGYMLDGVPTYTYGEETASLSGDGTTESPYYFTMPDNDVTVTASFTKKPFNITVEYPNGNHGTVEDLPTTAVSGQGVSFTVTPDNGYDVSVSASFNNGATPDQFSFNAETGACFFKMPPYNVTITIDYTAEAVGRTFQLVTSTDDLVAGEHYVLVNPLKTHVLTGNAPSAADFASGTNDRRMAVPIYLSNDQKRAITEDPTAVWTLRGSTGQWQIEFVGCKDKDGNSISGYLQTGETSNNLDHSLYLKSSTDNGYDAEKTYVSISFDQNNGHAVIVFNEVPSVSGNPNEIQENSQNIYCGPYSSNQHKLYLYRETTLAQIEATKPTGNVTIANDLQVVAIVDKEIDENTTIQVAFARDFALNDDGKEINTSIAAVTCPSLDNEGGENDPIDFMRKIAVGDPNDHQDGEWKQNNWVMLDFTNVATIQFGALSKNCVIKGGTLTGTYNNYTFSVNNGFTYQAGTAVGNYTPNVYSPANFQLDGNGCQTVGEGNDAVKYWFMTPKPMEVCKFTWAMWYNQGTYESKPGFYMQDGDTPLKGGIAADMTYNYAEDENGQAMTVELDDLTPGASYRFMGVIMKVEPGKKDPNDPTDPDNHYPQDDSTLNNKFKVATLNLNPDDEDQVITAVNEVKTDGKVVSVTYCDLAGRMSQKPFAGVNIIVTRYSDGTVKTTKAIK